MVLFSDCLFLDTNTSCDTVKTTEPSRNAENVTVPTHLNTTEFSNENTTQGDMVMTLNSTGEIEMTTESIDIKNVTGHEMGKQSYTEKLSSPGGLGQTTQVILETITTPQVRITI